MIQYGTSFFYPPCVMGAHYSTVPNHTTGRTASVEARMAAALSGTFGFELDLTQYTPEQLEELRPFVDFYHAHGALLRTGTLYRLCPPDSGAAWAMAAPDGSEAVVFASGCVLDGRSLPLPFAAGHQAYRAAMLATGLEGRTERYSGESLAVHGLPLPALRGNMPGFLCHLPQED